MGTVEVNLGRRSGSVCVQCLRDDLNQREEPRECRPYMRGYWQVVSSCRAHALWLLDIRPSCRAKLSRTRLHATRCRCGADLLGADLNPVTDAAHLRDEEPILLEAQGIAPVQPVLSFPACTGRCGRACSVDHRLRFSRMLTELHYHRYSTMTGPIYGEPELSLFDRPKSRTSTIAKRPPVQVLLEVRPSLSDEEVKARVGATQAIARKYAFRPGSGFDPDQPKIAIRAARTRSLK